MRYLAFAMCVLVAGCGPRIVPVRGEVSFEKKPLDQGLIAFIPMAGTTAASGDAKIVDGKYEILPGLVRGDYVVEIRSWKKTGKRVQGIYGETDEQVNVIPERYFKNSVLRFTPADDPDKMDFQLTK